MKELLQLSAGCAGAVWFYGGHPTARHRPHHHDELEFNLVISGSARYFVGERRYDLSPGSLIWLFPRQDHVLLDESRQFSMWIAVIQPALLRKLCRGEQTQPLLAKDPGDVLARSLHPKQRSRLASLLEDIAPSIEDPQQFNAGLSYAILRAWSSFHAAEADAIGFEVHPAVEKAARLLRDESEPEHLESLANRCNLSRSRLSRLFKQQAGVSLVEYRQRQCLERFLNLYGRGRRLTILDAALQAGFGSYANFHRTFKRLMRQSPAHYRRQQRE